MGMCDIGCKCDDFCKTPKSGSPVDYAKAHGWDKSKIKNHMVDMDVFYPIPDYDAVEKPSHYMAFPDMEAIDIIRKVLTPDEFKGYCKGNILKYRLRAGNKDKLEQDIGKADKYREWLGDMT